MDCYLSIVFSNFLEIVEEIVHWLILRVTIYHWIYQRISIFKYLAIIDCWLPYFVYSFMNQYLISDFLKKGSCLPIRIEILVWSVLHLLDIHLLILEYVHLCIHVKGFYDLFKLICKTLPSYGWIAHSQHVSFLKWWLQL